MRNLTMEQMAVLAPLAQARLTEIANERKQILTVFPHFRDIGAENGHRREHRAAPKTENGWAQHPQNQAALKKAAAVTATTETTKGPGRRKWSASARKAAGERMRAYWAKRKRAEKK